MFKKTVLITGASRGIGNAIARQFAGDEYNVCINYNNSKEEAIKLKNDILNKGFSCNIYKADVRKTNEVDNMVENIINDYGRIDILVNNAGICEYKLFVDITAEEFKAMLDTNVVGVFNVTKSVLNKSMLKHSSGSIVNISSIWGMVGASLETNYSTSKAAIIGMTKALAKELGMSGIRVNAVAPGMVNTKMNSHMTKEEIKDFEELIPMGRQGDLNEIASVVKFLAGNEASYITGQVISPNGGVVV